MLENGQLNITNWSRRTTTLELLCAAVLGVPSRRWQCAWVTFTSSGLWVCRRCEWWTPSSLSLREKHAGSSTSAWWKAPFPWIYRCCREYNKARKGNPTVWFFCYVHTGFIIHPAFKSLINKSCGFDLKSMWWNTHTHTQKHAHIICNPQTLKTGVMVCPFLSVKTMFERKSPAHTALSQTRINIS